MIMTLNLKPKLKMQKTGDNSIIDTGNIDKKEMPTNTVAVCVPCKPIRKKRGKQARLLSARFFKTKTFK